MRSNNYVIKKLDWETTKLGYDVFEITILVNIDPDIWYQIFKKLSNIKLIIIKNSTLNRNNSIFIGKKTDALLLDTNLSLLFEMSNLEYIDTCNDYKNIIITNDFNWNIKEMLKFENSRFLLDPNLKSSIKDSIYVDWIESSKRINNKNFLFYIDNDIPIGFILFKIKEDTATIELISVLNSFIHKGIGSIMIDYLKIYLSSMQIKQLNVGTQISNTKAINFYIRNGFKVESSTDIYHWWRTCNEK